MIDNIYSNPILSQDTNNQEVKTPSGDVKGASLLSKIDEALSVTLKQSEGDVDIQKIDQLQKQIDQLQQKIDRFGDPTDHLKIKICNLSIEINN